MKSFSKLRAAFVSVPLALTVLYSKERSSIFGWGNGIYGQTGVGHEKAINSIPEQLQFDASSVEFLGAGAESSSIITKDGQVYLFGRSKDGALGKTSTFLNIIRPKSVKCPVEGKPVQVSLGKQHGGLVTDKGELLLWGSNTRNQLGPIANSSDSSSRNSKPMALNQKFKENLIKIEGKAFKALSCGNGHTV